MKTCFLFLECFALAYIVGHSKISLPLRVFLGGIPDQKTPIKPLFGYFGSFLCELLECCACFGFWEGWVLGFGAFWGFWTLPFEINPVALGLLVCGSNFVLSRLTRLA